MASASPREASARCRRLLTGLLQPLGGIGPAADAARLLDHFGSLRPRGEILSAVRGDAALIAQLILIRQTMRRTLRQGVDDRPLIKHYAGLQDYLCFAQGCEITELGAAGLILVHNHPSEIAEPSSGDKAMTRRAAAAARELCMRMAS